MLQVTFPEIARVLEGLHSPVPAAEGHGCLCGALCTSAHYSLQRWLEDIIPDEECRSDDDSRQPLQLLFTDTLLALRSEQMDLELLLPDDDMELQSRAVALSQWCQGFLYGFGTGQPFQDDELPADVDEVLLDLTAIGQGTARSGEVTEEEEQAYAEVVEYVRIGVQLIHEEMLLVRSVDGSFDEGEGEDGDTDDDDGPPHPADLH